MTDIARRLAKAVLLACRCDPFAPCPTCADARRALTIRKD